MSHLICILHNLCENLLFTLCTGDIAFRFMDYSPRGSREVTVCDANGKMIRYGKRKAKRLGKTEGIGCFDCASCVVVLEPHYNGH